MGLKGHGDYLAMKSQKSTEIIKMIARLGGLNDINKDRDPKKSMTEGEDNECSLRHSELEMTGRWLVSVSCVVQGCR